MKSVLLSVRPQWVVKILNGEKTIEIRKKFPSDYVGWVYIYCTKNGNDCYGMPTDLVDYRGCAIYNKFKLMPKGEKVTTDDNQPRLNGKVIARFWCDKVEEIDDCFTMEHIGNEYPDTYELGAMEEEQLLKECCLTKEEMNAYYKGVKEPLKAIHITKLEILYKPKEISEFRKYCDKHFSWWTNRCLDCRAYTPDTDIEDYCNENKLALTRAPQSWCFIEIGE